MLLHVALKRILLMRMFIARHFIQACTCIIRAAAHMEIRESREFEKSEKKFDEKVREIHEKLLKSGKSLQKIKLFCKGLRKC